MKKFELTLQHIKKSRNNERDEQQNNLKELVNSVEKKYQNQLSEVIFLYS